MAWQSINHPKTPPKIPKPNHKKQKFPKTPAKPQAHPQNPLPKKISVDYHAVFVKTARNDTPKTPKKQKSPKTPKKFNPTNPKPPNSPKKFPQKPKIQPPKTKFKNPYKLSQKFYDIVLINERNFVEIHFKRIYNGRRNAYCNKCRRTSRCRGKHKQF